jgi:hypothetical protein
MFVFPRTLYFDLNITNYSIVENNFILTFFWERLSNIHNGIMTIICSVYARIYFTANFNTIGSLQYSLVLVFWGFLTLLFFVAKEIFVGFRNIVWGDGFCIGHNNCNVVGFENDI